MRNEPQNSVKVRRLNRPSDITDFTMATKSISGSIPMKLKIALILCATAFLNGCAVVGPSVELKPAKVRIPGVIVGGSQKHCPPGQAKKGNC